MWFYMYNVTCGNTAKYSHFMLFGHDKPDTEQNAGLARHETLTQC